MFFHVTLTQRVDLEPAYFGPALRETIRRKVVDKVEGTCSAQHGYIVSVLAVDDVSKGVVRQDSSGLASFVARFQAIALRAFRGEVLDAVVTGVNRMGFFAEAGPLQVFVSSHLLPDDYSYAGGLAAGGDAFVAADGEAAAMVREGAEVRVRVVGVRADAADVFCIATMRDDYLGVVGV